MEGRERDSAAGMIRLRFHLYVVDCTPLVWQFLGQPQTNTDELSCDEHRTQMKIKAMSAELFFQPFPSTKKCTIFTFDEWNSAALDRHNYSRSNPLMENPEIGSKFTFSSGKTFPLIDNT